MDGEISVGDNIVYTFSLLNDGNVTQRFIYITDHITDFNGNVRQLDAFASPNRLNFISATQGSPNGTLISGEIATYTATYTVQNEDTASGGISNTASATSYYYENGEQKFVMIKVMMEMTPMAIQKMILPFHI